MIALKYSYPLPNNGSRYSFTEMELIKLLDSVYDKGFEDGVAVSKPIETTTISTSETLTIKYDNNYLDTGSSIASNTKCPHCGESFYTEMYSESTAVYYPPIYKDGVNINPDRNTTTRHCRCLNCGEEFTI